jgi:hypothetical protein
VAGLRMREAVPPSHMPSPRWQWQLHFLP